MTRAEQLRPTNAKALSLYALVVLGLHVIGIDGPKLFLTFAPCTSYFCLSGWSCSGPSCERCQFWVSHNLSVSKPMGYVTQLVSVPCPFWW